MNIIFVQRKAVSILRAVMCSSDLTDGIHDDMNERAGKGKCSSEADVCRCPAPPRCFAGSP